MEKEFLPYELALRIKAIDFNEPCFGYYNALGNFNLEIDKVNADCNKLGMYGKYCTAPTFSQAFRWFREKYELSSWVYNSHMDKYFYTILQDGRIVKATESATTFEEAELACLEKLIEIVENQK